MIPWSVCVFCFLQRSRRGYLENPAVDRYWEWREKRTWHPFENPEALGGKAFAKFLSARATWPEKAICIENIQWSDSMSTLIKRKEESASFSERGKSRKRSKRFPWQGDRSATPSSGCYGASESHRTEYVASIPQVCQCAHTAGGQWLLSWK